MRGGGEYGRDWYEAGKLENKHKVFEDLFAIAENLIARGEATPETLAMNGLSNGGLLAGAAIAHRPDLWRVVVPQVPLFDLMEGWPLTPDYAMIRAVAYEDYGNTEKPEEARMVFAWSPYQNLKDDTAYPAVFQIFGETDAGCLPFHGRKFTAALQHANTSDRPILYHLWKGVGHQPLDPEISASYYAEWLCFVMDQLGMPNVKLGEFRAANAGGNG
ncbi:prolyl oligopeptidase family serine peptidase [Sphingosinicella rhizophila]|uniref:prolyl oligopeptidase n=1 Tax=Sphingosinicella rhizophila TaxID=3050082 RepID=A0ABU3Q9X9_9SPHN|nr:prolyl oligopeptidase family serine peptidase [Sphingosinicella sp. GR2756]MDT9600202.1 prolyl oligopeptidase family serine peptidase [Sphingosinicella sp. GR2756]